MGAKKTSGTKKRSRKQTDNDRGGITFQGPTTVGGDVIGRDQIVHGGYQRGNTTTNIAVREKLFEEIFQQIEQRPNTTRAEKADLKTDVAELKAEAEKGQKADENFLARRVRNILRMAPDILEVVMAAISNPAAGFAKVVEKIAKKAAASGSDT